MADDETPDTEGDTTPDTEPAPDKGDAAEAPAPGTLHVKANANLTLGGVFIAVGEEGDVPDGVETRQCAEMNLIEILHDPNAAAEEVDDQGDDGDKQTRRRRGARSAAAGS